MDSVPTTISDEKEPVPHWMKKTPSHAAPKAAVASHRAQIASRRANRINSPEAHERAMRMHNHAAERQSKVIEYH